MNEPRRGTPDFLLLLLTFLLVGFGLVMVFSASSVTALAKEKFNNDPLYFVKKQAIFAVAGTVGMFFLMNVPAAKLRPLLRPGFICVLVLLALVPFLGIEVNGARSWFYFGSFGMQPSEFAKVAVILYLALLISKKGEKFRDLKKGLLPTVIIVGIVAGMIMMQPDFGSTMILVLAASLVIVVGGANLKHIFLAISSIAGIAAVFLTIYVLSASSLGYRMDRVACYLNPWSDPQGSCYQIVQSLYAFGHGELTGAGFGQSIQKMHYLPEAHNDFIFAIIGEELGFFGTLLFLFLYLAFLWRGFIISLRCPDNFGSLAGTGIVGLIGIQALINMGGVTGTIPMTGVTLPFISYGGSSLLVTMCSIGILLSISREHARQEKERKSGNIRKVG
ncbi:putative lipid II flippase FtsW [Paenibacillus flagellatus]|uniref:Probable peptidoglycan glycosyltransferase FtsW n=1 Tax=Paenibacillus flagellatus TaxID=2211139 RepID=A0A2V5K514_9BACL|nr:putative lipid II flippase FtsW [Paenibacillus flagellatus]PYI54401.1 putative lipid II flippase FtsW [Paenibacillus flagellatus]